MEPDTSQMRKHNLYVQKKKLILLFQEKNTQQSVTYSVHENFYYTKFNITRTIKATVNSTFGSFDRYIQIIIKLEQKRFPSP